ncbi:hypothetical protein [Wielerella bovis]|uniref:hypothetical protein n=1 Tax=Wielerella bovis TaxID=2917790 RepID=UPI0020189CFE|nr:hypothetical protein [Wielerella bovis]ULJ65689.1 hypothetical protein MIS33_05395 [Wielerella bovis]ULJ66268.1 hypothetical protein MIS31_08310 [Wielerella bovis]
MKKLLLSTILLTVSHIATAEIYSCGPGCYTSSPKKATEGRARITGKIGSYTSITPERKVVAATENSEKVAAPARTQTVRRSAPVAPRVVPQAVAATTTPAIPKMSAARASGRRTILEQELNNERSALSAAQKALADGRAIHANDANHQARVRQLESAVLDRQQNIQALQRELSRM